MQAHVALLAWPVCMARGFNTFVAFATASARVPHGSRRTLSTHQKKTIHGPIALLFLLFINPLLCVCVSTMKFSLAAALVFAVPAATTAFAVVPAPPHHQQAPSTSSGSQQARRATTRLALSARPDTSGAIQAALEATEKYGASSPEARVAWDAVEEMDASDNT
jgi:hypothetical protein